MLAFCSLSYWITNLNWSIHPSPAGGQTLENAVDSTQEDSRKGDTLKKTHILECLRRDHAHVLGKPRKVV